MNLTHYQAMGKNLWLLLFLAGGTAFAQLEPNTVTISASRTINVLPDQAVFGLTVSSGMSAGLDQVVAPLASLNITSANLSGISNYSSGMLQWNFSLTAPLSSITTVLAALATLQQTITQNNSGLTLDLSLNGTRVSAQLQQSQTCSTAGLIADATTQAQKLVAAAGLVLGPILDLSTAPPTPASPGYVFVSNFLVGVPATPVNCSLTVKFQLLQ